LMRKDEMLCVVERKTISDFISSITHKDSTGLPRIFSQLQRLTDYDCPTYIFVAGSLEDYADEYLLQTQNEFNPSVVYGTVASIAVRFNIPVLMFIDEEMMFQTMFEVFKKIAQGKYSNIHLEAKSKAKARDMLSIAVPISTADRLLAHFLTLRNLANASVEEIKKVPGVGEKTARRIFELFHGV